MKENDRHILDLLIIKEFTIALEEIDKIIDEYYINKKTHQEEINKLNKEISELKKQIEWKIKY